MSTHVNNYPNEVNKLLNGTITNIPTNLSKLLTSIGDGAFSVCPSLTSINLPKVTSIGRGAFSSCSKLTAIHFSASNKSKIEANSYYSSKWGATNATIYFDL